MKLGVWGLVTVAAAASAGIGALFVGRANDRLPTGRYLDPVGSSVLVGSFPTNLILSPDGKWLFTTTSGAHEFVSVLSGVDGHLVSQVPVAAPDSLYYGLACDSSDKLFVSMGVGGRVQAFNVGPDGVLTLASSLHTPGGVGNLPVCPAGLALSDSGAELYVANNESNRATHFKGSVTVLDSVSESVLGTIPTGGFPFAVVQKGGKGFVSSEQDDVVTAFDTESHAVLAVIPVGGQPTGLAFSKSGDKLYVANSNSDTISVVDTSSLKVVQTLLLRPAEVRGLPGITPVGLAVGPDNKELYVACADLNAIAALDLTTGRVVGYIPAGWYPTAVQVGSDGKRLFVSNGKGVRAHTPNNTQKDRYILNILDGAVTTIDLPAALADLPHLTHIALSDAGMLANAEARNKARFRNPGIQHVIYIIKENRTYDQVMGDEKAGNGDPSLTLYGAGITPNEHALADRFGLFDNFFCCAEVSADGWNWSTGGMVNEYSNRNTIYNYTRDARDYDFEGETNGVPRNLMGQKDVGAPPGGYLWDDCAAHGVSYRSYGFFDMFEDSPERDDRGAPLYPQNTPDQKALVNHSDNSFRLFDLTYPDSEAYLKLGLPPTPRQKKGYGIFNSPSRFSEWKREFDRYVANHDLPAVTMLRFMRDHTSGSAVGLGSPRAMVADNDYAVGELVDAVSHSPYWTSTAICIVEDDAQNGFDHVDCHRSPALVVSAYNQPGLVDHRFYNTDAVLRTMELLVGLPPMCQYDALAAPFQCFSDTVVNPEPFTAIVPDKKIAGEVNQRRDYGSRESEIFVHADDEDTIADWRLNTIQWRLAKGNAPIPRTPGLVALK